MDTALTFGALVAFLAALMGDRTAGALRGRWCWPRATSPNVWGRQHLNAATRETSSKAVIVPAIKRMNTL